MHFLGYLLLAIAIPNLVFGSFILLRNFRDLTNLFFGGFVLAATLWTFGLAAYLFSRSDSTAIDWAREYYLAAAAIPPLFLGFSLNFTHNWQKAKRSYILASLVPIALAAMLVLVPGYLINGVREHDWGKEVILNHSGYLLYTVYFVLFVGGAFAIFLQSLRRASGLMRVNLRFIFGGTLAAFALGMAFNLFYPALGNYRYIWVGPLSILVYIAVITYAIVRHRLFDIRFFVVRSMAYFLTFFVLSLIYVLPAIFLTSRLINTSLNAKAVIILALVTLSVVLIYQPLRKYFNEATARLFFRDYYEPQDILDKISDLLVGTVSVQDIEIQSAAILMDALKPTHLSYLLTNDKSSERLALLTELLKTKLEVVVADNINLNLYASLHERMRAEDVAMAVRLQTPHGNLGFMLLGYKKSGASYSRTDKKLLAIAADDIAVGLQNALRFEQISQFNITLKQKVEEATAELQQANTHLKELDVIKDEFISMATHQLGTPLAVIDGYLSMVIDDSKDRESKDDIYLNQALRRVRLMKRLVADFLNVSRIDAGRFTIERSETDIYKLVNEEVEQLLQKAHERGVKLSFIAHAKSLPTLNIDEAKTRLAVMNLIDNAIFYSPRGEVKVYLDKDDKKVVFKVVDNGIGVPERQKKELFNKFARADNAKKERPEGTGIGLYLVKRVVEDQNGSIIFDSQEGLGSTFGFSLPLGTQAASAPTAAGPAKADNVTVEEKAAEVDEVKEPPQAKPPTPPPRRVIKKKYYTIS